MDVIEFINTIIANNFNDWVRCHNDLLHHEFSSNEIMPSNELDDKEIRIIGHILKVLYNVKTSIMNKYYLLISIEENLEYFIKTENGAIHMVQSLTSDLKNILQTRFDHRYICQLIVVICSCSVYYDLFVSSSHQCASLIPVLLSILFDIISNDNNTTNWINVKYTSLTSLLHLESTYPTLLCQYESRLSNLVHHEKSIYFELLVETYSLVFRNNILNKCRLQQSIGISEVPPAQTKVYNNEKLCSFMSWSRDRDSCEEKIIGSQLSILKSLRNMLDQAMTYLSPLAINAVVRHCLTVTNCLSQHNTALWTPFIGRFSLSLNLSILEALVTLKVSSKSCTKDGMTPSEQLPETLLSILCNSRIFVPKRQVVAQWLYSYPIDERTIYSVPSSDQSADMYRCYFEPEMLRHFCLRSMDIIDIKYCKLMLLSRVIKTSTESDCNSFLLYSSLKEIIKSLHYFDSDLTSNILLRVMFAMHIRHSHSVLARDFESCLEGIVVRYPSILSAVMFYLNGLEKHLTTDEQSHNFSVKCLTQIARLSSDKLSTMTNYSDFSSIKLHIHVLDYIIKFTDINLAGYLTVLYELLISCKLDSPVTCLEEAYDLVLNLCFNIVKKYGSSKFCQELTNILNEIRNGLIGNNSGIKADFLYALIVSLPSKKIREVLHDRSIKEINEKDFGMLQNTLLRCVEEDVLKIRRKSSANTSVTALYQYGDSLNEYMDFLNNTQFPLQFDVELQSINNYQMENILCGINIDFQTDSLFVDIAQWHIPMIRCKDGNDCTINRSMEVTIKEPETFSIFATLAATKCDGTFVMYSVVEETIELLELAVNVPIEFPSHDAQSTFVRALYQGRLHSRSFVSINFKNASKLARFNDSCDRFVVVKDDGDASIVYLMFLPPKYHIVLKSSFITAFCRRFDVYTDLKMIHLLSIERYLKHFEL